MAEDIQNNASQPEPARDAEAPAYNSFEEYLETAEPTVKELYEKHISSLKNALNAERDNRRKLSEQLKEIAPKAEKGSELERQLAETAKTIEELEQRSREYERQAQFASEAIKPEIGCVNVDAAYALAVVKGLFNQEGKPLWNELKKSAPQLFRSEATSTTAAGRSGKVADDINAAIRRAAGYGG